MTDHYIGPNYVQQLHAYKKYIGSIFYAWTINNYIIEVYKSTINIMQVALVGYNSPF